MCQQKWFETLWTCTLLIQQPVHYPAQEIWINSDPRINALQRSLATTLSYISGRRSVWDATSHRQKSWSYQIVDSIPSLGQSGLLDSLHVADLPILRSFHISDVVLYGFAENPEILGKNSLNIMSTLIAFWKSLDLNTHGLDDFPQWPNYDSTERMQFKFAENGTEIFKEDDRTETFDYINNNREVFKGWACGWSWSREGKTWRQVNDHRI